MADNVQITTGTGPTVATDDVGGVQHQRVKVEFGADGAATDVSQAAPLPTRPGIPTTQAMSRVAINCAASGDNTLVAAVAAQKIRVWGFFLKVAGAVNMKFKNGAGTDFHPALPFVVNGDGWVEDLQGEALFECAVNTALILNLSAAVQVSGYLYYTQEA